jgi:hypothetical protein
MSERGRCIPVSRDQFFAKRVALVVKSWVAATELPPARGGEARGERLPYTPQVDMLADPAPPLLAEGRGFFYETRLKEAELRRTSIVAQSTEVPMAARSEPPYRPARWFSRVVPFLAILIAAVLTAAGLLMIWEAPMVEPENTTTIPQTNPPR